MEPKQALPLYKRFSRSEEVFIYVFIFKFKALLTRTATCIRAVCTASYCDAFAKPLAGFGQLC